MYEKVKKVISFYKFTNISKLHETRDKVFNNLKYNSILGTVIIANEGINVNISGSENNVNHAKKCSNIFSGKILAEKIRDGFLNLHII